MSMYISILALRIVDFCFYFWRAMDEKKRGKKREKLPWNRILWTDR